MEGWPQIPDPLLTERLAMSDVAFDRHLLQLTSALGRREHTPEAHARALSYPWARPARSYRLAGGRVTLLDDLGPAERERILAGRAGPPTDPARTRIPLLAFGSNAAPGALRTKLGHLPPPHRDVLVLAGTLHDFDVGPSSHPTLYGAMAATIFPSPGTRVRAAVLWVTAPQFVQLTWSEITYRLGRLQGVRFTGDDAGHAQTEVLAYASRFGSFTRDGRPVALAAVPAEGRTAVAVSQEQALDAAARLAYGPGGTARDVVRRLFEDATSFVRDDGPAIRAAGLFLRDPRFVAYPGPGAA